MAKLPSSFNSEEHEAPDYEPLKPGVYIGRIVDSEWKDCSESAKDPNGKYIKLTFELDAGQEGAGRMIWVNLNLVNKNEKAVAIAQGELSAITQACGKKVINDTQELHGIPMKLKVAVKKDGRGPDYPDQNVIKGYKPAESSASSGEGSSSKKGRKAPWD